MEDERIVFAYAMLVGDRRVSASLATIAREASPKGTKLTFTEQATFFDKSNGPKLREEGWTGLLTKIDRVVSA